LQSLKIDFLNDRTLLKLATGFRSLSKIVIMGGYPPMMNRNTISLEGFSSFLQAMNGRLTYISLSYSRFEILTDHRIHPQDWIHPLATYAPNLLCVNLAQCERVTDDGLVALATRCNRLLEINLSYCVNISDSGIKFMAAQCLRLTHIRIAGCRRVTDASLVALSTHCHSISTIHLSNCRRITDAGLIALCSGCSQMATIYLDKLVRLTDVGITTLIDKCNQLTFINLYYCKRISTSCLQLMLISCKQLRYACLHKPIPIVFKVWQKRFPRVCCYVYEEEIDIFRVESYFTPAIIYML
jgi:hypothetical protein